jgi:hypothetical protein
VQLERIEPPDSAGRSGGGGDGTDHVTSDGIKRVVAHQIRTTWVASYTDLMLQLSADSSFLRPTFRRPET